MYKAIFLVAGFAVVIGATAFFSYKAGGDSVRATLAAEASRSVELARKEEQNKQVKTNAITQTQIEELGSINSTLNSELSRLRSDTVNRRRMSENTSVDCKGSNGSDLSTVDAEFLTREAARADTLRTSLKSCYDYADLVGDK